MAAAVIMVIFRLPVVIVAMGSVFTVALRSTALYVDVNHNAKRPGRIPGALHTLTLNMLLLGFVHSTPVVQQRLGITGRLLDSLEDQVAGGLEGTGACVIRSHRRVVRVACVLLVDHLGHALQSLPDTLGINHT